MQSVGTLAGGVAHEFNNLLAGINGYASLGLREADLTPTLREFLQHVVALSERAAQLTRQLLAFARKPALSRQPHADARAAAKPRPTWSAGPCTRRCCWNWMRRRKTARR